MKNVAGLIAAAGRSSRMGRHKALLPFADVTFVEHLVACFLRAGIDDVLVTLPVGLEVKLSVQSGLNRYDDEGLSGSLKTALEIFAGADAIVFTPVDAPFVDERALSSLVTALDTNDAVVVAHGGQHGHPAGLSRARLRQLASSSEGARGLMDDAFVVESDDPRVLLNINTPLELERALDR